MLVAVADFMPESPEAVPLKNAGGEHFIFQRISLIPDAVAAVIPGGEHMGSAFYGNSKLPVVMRLGIFVKAHDFPHGPDALIPHPDGFRDGIRAVSLQIFRVKDHHGIPPHDVEHAVGGLADHPLPVLVRVPRHVKISVHRPAAHGDVHLHRLLGRADIGVVHHIKQSRTVDFDFVYSFIQGIGGRFDSRRGNGSQRNILSMSGTHEYKDFISFLRSNSGGIVKFVQGVDISHLGGKLRMAVSLVGRNAEFLVFIGAGFHFPRNELQKLRQRLEVCQGAPGIDGGTARVSEHFQQLPVERGFRLFVKTDLPYGKRRGSSFRVINLHLDFLNFLKRVFKPDHFGAAYIKLSKVLPRRAGHGGHGNFIEIGSGKGDVMNGVRHFKYKFPLHMPRSGNMPVGGFQRTVHSLLYGMAS